MKKSLITITALTLLLSMGFTQKLNISDKIAKISISKPLTAEQNEYPVCGTLLAMEKDKEMIEYFAQHPELRNNIKKPSASWGFNIGDPYNWWTKDWSSNGDYLVPSTCRGIGDDCYVFVADSLWHEGGYFAVVSQENVDDIVEHFSNTTANFPNQGIYDVNVATFGDPPDIDGDHRIIILILDIYQENVGGYFTSLNEYPDGTYTGRKSNEAEMYYMDYSGLNNLAFSRGLQAHEFQHMIHFNHDLDEITFVNEGLSMTAEYVCGYYEDYYYNLYQQDTNEPLFKWGESGEVNTVHYARSALWTLYLLEQYPNDFLKMLVQEPDDAEDGIDLALGTYGATRNWQEILEDWLIANYLQDTSVDPRWGYTYQNAIASIPVVEHNTANVSSNGSVWKTSGQYISFKSSIPDTITFTYSSNDIKVKAIKIGNPKIVEDVPKGVPYIIKPIGETYSDVTFCVINLNNSPYAIYADEYSYEAKGTDAPVLPGNYELFYDDGIPDGTLSNYATGDSIAVRFDGISGGKLDSIKTIFSGAGRIKLDISMFDGTNFLRGEALMTAMNVNVTESSDWKTTNLISNNIDASSNFVVSYLLGTDPYEPSITVSAESDDGSANHFSYIASSDDWVRYTAGAGLIWKYMIRAYVSVEGGTVAIDQNGIVTIPNEFSLEQNYPNPFNPSTTFQFATPKDGLVKFTVHDLLGRVIYSENRDLFAGHYSFTWDGQNQLDQQVVSGVYFLRMETEGFVLTRKMLMMK